MLNSKKPKVFAEVRGLNKKIIKEMDTTATNIVRGINAMRKHFHVYANAQREKEIGEGAHENDRLELWQVGDLVRKRLNLLEQVGKLEDKWSGPY